MAIDVGSAVGYLDLNISGFLAGLQTAQSEGNKVENKFKVVGGKMQSVGDKMSKIGSTMTKTFTTPIVTAVTAVVNQYAKLEQAVGGVETLFKDSADAVITNSETAYMRAGVSGVQYMEQVTSFSARLLQGLGGDTEKAAKIADMAMVDMSDNANKFGTDISAIQNAYQGFAKANFTMLDNLKLGYGGTAGEMARLINESGVLGKEMKATADNVKDIPFDAMIRAINVTQKRMGIFGTTSLEATETVSGSFGALKASVLDFAAGMGGANADVKFLTQNMIGTFKTFAKNVVRVLKNIWDNLPLSDTQKKLIGIVAVAGPILIVLGKVVTVAGMIVTSIGAIKSALTLLAANPVMIWILGGALAVGAIAGIITAITEATSKSHKLKETLANMDMTISEGSRAAIGRGIEEGIAIANKTFEVELVVKAEVEEVTQQVHATFGKIVADAKGRFGATEMQELKTAVNTYVGGAIDQINTTVAARAGEVAAEMDRLGVDEAIKQAAVDAVYAQGDSAIADLQAYETSAEAILEAIAANGGKATKAQQKEFTDLIGKIKDIGTEWNAVDTDSMIAKLEGAYDAITAIPKKKLSSNELTKLKTSVKTFVGGAVDEVNTTVKAKAAEVATAMDALGMSDEVKKQAVEGVTSRGDTMVADLQEYERQALLLLKEMGQAGENVTQDQITAFENLMLQIGAIKTEIGLMANDMDGKIEALRNKVQRGLATEEEISTVVNYDLQMGKLRIEQAQADYDADLEQFGVALQNSTEANKPEIEMALDLRTEQFEAEVASAREGTTSSLSEMWNGIIANTESGSAALNNAVYAANAYAAMAQMFDMPEGFDSLDDEAKAQVTEMLINAVPHLTAEQINAPMAPIGIYAMEAMGAINQNITDGAAEIEQNESLKQALNVMLESGALDNVDLTSLPDTLKGALAALNFAESGGEIGDDVMSGLGLGFSTGEGEAKGELETAAQSIIDAAKAKFGIQSPSTVFDEMGQQNMAGLSKGHQTGMGTVQSELESAAESMWTSVEHLFVAAVEQIVEVVDAAFATMPKKLEVHTAAVKANLTVWGTQMGTAGTNAGRTLVCNTVAQTNGLPAKMQTAGREAMAGFERGINDKIASIKVSVKIALNEIVMEMKKVLEIASPSKRIAREIGVFIPAGLAVGVQTAMPQTIRDIQRSLDKGVDDIEVPDLQVAAVSPMDGLSSFIDQLKQRYEQMAIWFESIEARVVQSIENMSAALGGFIQRTDIVFNGAGVLGQIPVGGYGPTIKYEVPVRQDRDYRDVGEGDTFIFNSPKPIDEIEAARQMKKTKRDLSEGF